MVISDKSEAKNYSMTKECRSTVRDEALYLTMLSAFTPTLQVFHIISVLPLILFSHITHQINP